MESIRVKVTFPEALVPPPWLADMVRAFQVSPNFRRGAIEEHVGWIVCEVDGEIHEVERALDWLRAEGVQVDLLGDLLES